MVDSVAGSIVGNQLQGVRTSVAALKTDSDLTQKSVRAIESNADAVKQPESSGRGSIVNIKV